MKCYCCLFRAFTTRPRHFARLYVLTLHVTDTYRVRAQRLWRRSLSSAGSPSLSVLASSKMVEHTKNISSVEQLVGVAQASGTASGFAPMRTSVALRSLSSSSSALLSLVTSFVETLLLCKSSHCPAVISPPLTVCRLQRSVVFTANCSHGQFKSQKLSICSNKALWLSKPL